MPPEDFSWHEVAERSAAGLCPASIGYDEPHIVPEGEGECRECGAQVDNEQAKE